MLGRCNERSLPQAIFGYFLLVLNSEVFFPAASFAFLQLKEDDATGDATDATFTKGELTAVGTPLEVDGSRSRP